MLTSNSLSLTKIFYSRIKVTAVPERAAERARIIAAQKGHKLIVIAPMTQALLAPKKILMGLVE